MPQAVWTGTISFGLVSIPVRLYPATEPKDVRFHLYDRRSGRRIRYERVTRDYEPPTFTPETTDGSRRELRGADERYAERGRRPQHEPDMDLPAESLADVRDVVRGLQLPTGDVVTVTHEELELVAEVLARSEERLVRARAALERSKAIINRDQALIGREVATSERGPDEEQR